MAETIYWSKNATATIGASGQTNWTNAREAAESSISTLNSTSLNIAVTKLQRFSSRGTPSYGLGRAYFAFDFSSYTTGTITNLKFHYKPTTSSNFGANHYLVKFTGFGSTSTFSNYDDSSWWDDISTIGAANTYTAAFLIADNSTATSVSLTSQAITDAQSDGFLQVVLMNTGDYNDLQPPADTDLTTYFNIGSATGGSLYLQFDYVAEGYTRPINGSEVQYNAVNNISALVIEKVNDLAD